MEKIIEIDMDYKNLYRAIEYLKNLPEEVRKDFDMEFYNKENECGSFKCIIGLCANLSENVLFKNFQYLKWSCKFFFSEENNLLMSYSKNICWHYLFASGWKYIDNTFDGAIRRMEYVYNNKGIPINAMRQLNGYEPLTY